MKKSIKSIVLAALLVMTPLAAKSVGGKNSLIGVDIGFNSLDMNGKNTTGVSVFDEKENFAHIGLKIGAESETYRIFLSTRYNNISDFDYSYLMGLEFQYLIGLTNEMNLFFGANGGYAEMKLVDSNKYERTISDPYYGGDIGINYHLNETMDLEFGVRYMSLDAQNLKNDITYSFDSIISTYVGIIYKF